MEDYGLAAIVFHLVVSGRGEERGIDHRRNSAMDGIARLEACLDHQIIEIDLVHRRPEGLVIVEGVPVADGLFKERHVLGILWLLDVQHHAAGLSTRRLSAKMRVIAERLVSCRNMVVCTQSKLSSANRERSSALALNEFHIVDAERFGAGQAIAQHGAPGVHRDHFGVGEGFGDRQHVVAEPAAQIENALGLEVRQVLFQPGDNRMTAAIIIGGQVRRPWWRRFRNR